MKSTTRLQKLFYLEYIIIEHQRIYTKENMFKDPHKHKTQTTFYYLKALLNFD